MSDRDDRVEKRGSKYVVLSKEGKVLGEHDTREAATEQLQAVEASKAREGNDRADGLSWRYDAVELRMDEAVKTPEGWRRIPSIIGRGDVVLPYLNADGTIRHEFRPASEVTDAASVESFSGLPVTNNHPPVHLDSTTARSFTLGSSATASAQGVNLASSVLLIDQSIIDDVDAGKRQLSPGYRIRFDPTPGVFRGQRYDGVQRDIRGNHIAVVDRGRQGPEVSLRMDSGDAVLAITTEEASVAGETNDKNSKPKTVTTRVDGQDIESDEATAVVLADVEKRRVTHDAALKAAEAKLASTDPPPNDEPDMTARIDALEATHAKALKDVEDKARADVRELELRLDVVATARAIVTDYDAGEKTRHDVQLDVIEAVFDADVKAKVEKKADAGYTQAHYEQAIAVHADSKQQGAKLLTLVKGKGKTEDRGDDAGKAMTEADEARRTAPFAKTK